MKNKEIIEYVRYSAELAAILEVSGWPKPGNVHRTTDHPDARYEHFLAGSIALGTSVSDAAIKGIRLARGRLEATKIGLGRLIKKAVLNIKRFHRGGNTHLGISLLFIPLAVAAAKTYANEEEMKLKILRDNIGKIIESATPLDAVRVYEAIAATGSPHELGRLRNGSVPDVYDKKAKKKLMETGTTLLDIMKASSHYDTIAKELANGMETSFKIGYQSFIDTFNRTGDVNIATVHTFLTILSKVPDTFIARKVGLKRTVDVKEAVKIGIQETMWISEMARDILKLGGLITAEGKERLWKFDKRLQLYGKDYNPGTTADLTAASIMIALLSGFRF